ARHRDAAGRPAANRDAAGEKIADVAIDVCVDGVLGREVDAVECVAEIVPVLRPLQLQEAVGAATGPQRRPLQGEPTLHSVDAEELDDRTVTGLDHALDDALAAPDGDDLVADQGWLQARLGADR